MRIKDELMTSKEVIKYLKISRATFFRLLSRGILKGMKVGHNWRFKFGEIEKYFMADAIAQPRCFKIEVLSGYSNQPDKYQVRRIQNSGNLVSDSFDVIYYTFMKLKDGTEIILMPTTELSKLPLLEQEHWIRHEYR
jgi:excisionase family DNA binding protein